MTEALAPSSLLLPMFSSAAMRAVVDDVARVQRMLDFSAALARAEAAVGVIPHNAVDPIAAAAKAEIAKLFEPLSHQGVAQTFIERLVASAQSRVPRR